MFDSPEDFISSGIAVIPIKTGDKRPDFRLLPDDSDGHPSWEPFKSELPSADLLSAWRSRGMQSYGVVCGWQGLTVLDFDDVTEYTRWQTWAARRGGLAAKVARDGFRVLTARGVHIYIRTPNQERNRKAGKVDIKFSGYVLGPGSIHPSGAIYRPLPGIIPWVEHLSDILPAVLLVHSPILSSSRQVAIPAPPAADPWVVAFQPPVKPAPGAIARIKTQLKIESFFSQLQDTGGHGRWHMALCPLHDDASPSMWVDSVNQICGCFAGCTQKPLDVINLFARINGLDNLTAIYILDGGSNDISFRV